MNKTLLLSAVFVTLLSGCAATQEAAKPETEAVATPEPVVAVNDYPTRERVDYVLECVAKHGGLSYINQYACGCKIDKIAEKMSFADYEAARTFTQMQKTPGEAGAPFRDPKQAKDLKAQFKEVDAQAEKACFVQ